MGDWLRYSLSKLEQYLLGHGHHGYGRLNGEKY